MKDWLTVEKIASGEEGPFGSPSKRRCIEVLAKEVLALRERVEALEALNEFERNYRLEQNERRD